MFYRRERIPAEADVAEMKLLLEAAGARDWALDRADQHRAAALACLASQPFDADAVAALQSLAELIIRRDR